MVQGLDDVVRAHQISSPTDPRMYRKAMPNACNLCHLDRSVLWTLDRLTYQWQRTVDPLDHWKSWYGGSLETPAGMVWLKHTDPVVRLVAADAYARSPLGPAAFPEVLESLSDPVAVNRMFGLFAVERILGRRLSDKEYSPMASPSVRAKQVKTLTKRLPSRVARPKRPR
jgi:hypothetical protein